MCRSDELTTETLQEADNAKEEKTPGQNTRSIPGRHILGIIVASFVLAYVIRMFAGSIDFLGSLMLGIMGSWVALIAAFTLQRFLVWLSRNKSFVQTSTGEVRVNLVWACVKSMRGDRGKRYNEKWRAYSRYIRGWAFTVYLVIALGWGMFLGLWSPVLLNIGSVSLRLCINGC